MHSTEACRQTEGMLHYSAENDERAPVPFRPEKLQHWKEEKEGGTPHKPSRQQQVLAHSRQRQHEPGKHQQAGGRPACEGAGGGLHRGATVRISHIGQASEDVVMGFAAAAHSFPRAKQLGRAAERKEKTRASVSF